MHKVPRNHPILVSLYRQLLQHARILDKNTINKCFLIGKPQKVFLRDYEDSLRFRLSSQDLEIIEQLINQHNHGEYYRPALPNGYVSSLSDKIKTIFRYGFPQEYANKIEKSISKSILTNKSNDKDDAYLQKCISFGFHSLKRLSGATHLIKQLPHSSNDIIKQAFYNESIQKNIENLCENSEKLPENSDFSKDETEKKDGKETKAQTGFGRYTRLPLNQPISLNSLKYVDFHHLHGVNMKTSTLAKTTKTDSDNDNNNNGNNKPSYIKGDKIEKGMLLVSHPMACVGQDELYRKVIYVIEASDDSENGIKDRIVGITLNNAYVMFNNITESKYDSASSSSNNKHKTKSSKNGKTKTSNKNKRNRKRTVSKSEASIENVENVENNENVENKESEKEMEDCFSGWYGEYNYVGGPVQDRAYPFCIMHNNKVFYNEFKQYSTIVLKDSKNEMKNIYWTWLTYDNHESIFNALLNLSHNLQNRTKNEKIDKNEKNEKIETVNQAENSTDIDTQSQSESTSETQKTDKYNVMEMISYGNDNLNENVRPMFKFYQQYTSWNYEQLMIEISNNVWFPVKLTDVNEERNLLMLQCPPKHKECKNAFNDWMWQYFLRSLDNEYKYLSVFPHLNESAKSEYYDLMRDFHSSWVVDIEETPQTNASDENDDLNGSGSTSDDTSDDEDEEDGFGGK